MEESLYAQLTHPASPPAISWWPPAPGWWVLGCALLLVMLLLPWLLRYARRRKRRLNRRTRQMLADVPAALPDAQWLAAINISIKQRLKLRGDEAATRLFGEAWLDFLCSRSPKARRDILQPLAADLYRPDVELTQAQRQALLTELRRWMRHDDV
ncbi:protein of unknown function [Halopseudomonas litoralis]|uniref:DUF4381 domain-containing protein n=1 Tax=Halopseudomonas litoralis TaxID=797277 RepID=A0A1H1PD77_9GAMM|nr:DUF4381 domain-containing protein [Halopseudomonas litoralis]SDS09084.1 protein of unknown function [Halopseudomonas litoralis]